jgi:hypothetical protein
MINTIVSFHIAVVIAAISFCYYSGKILGFLTIKSNSKYNKYAWIAFIIASIVIIAYCTYHCYDSIEYYKATSR